jgi:hypothetical protein
MKTFTWAVGLIMFWGVPGLAKAKVAGDWIVTGKNKIITSYVDPTSVYKTPSKNRRVKMLYDFGQPRSESGKQPYKSIVFFMQFDCEQNTYEMISSSRYSGQMGTGIKNGEAEASPKGRAQPGSAIEAAMKTACEKAEPLPNQPRVADAGWSKKVTENRTQDSAGQAKSVSNSKQEKSGGWDEWLEKTGGSGKLESGSNPGKKTGPFSTAEIEDACGPKLRYRFPSYRGGFIGEKTEVLPAIKPSQSGLPAAAIPQVSEMYPVRMFFTFKNGGGKGSANWFVWKTPFGEVTCMEAQ